MKRIIFLATATLPFITLADSVYYCEKNGVTTFSSSPCKGVVKVYDTKDPVNTISSPKRVKKSVDQKPNSRSSSSKKEKRSRNLNSKLLSCERTKVGIEATVQVENWDTRRAASFELLTTYDYYHRGSWIRDWDKVKKHYQLSAGSNHVYRIMSRPAPSGFEKVHCNSRMIF